MRRYYDSEMWGLALPVFAIAAALLGALLLFPGCASTPRKVIVRDCAKTTGLELGESEDSNTNIGLFVCSEVRQ